MDFYIGQKVKVVSIAFNIIARGEIVKIENGKIWLKTWKGIIGPYKEKNVWAS